jgi:uncharacterized protein (DUF433 family)
LRILDGFISEKLATDGDEEMIDMINQPITRRQDSPSIRDLDITFAEVLDWLASGQTHADIVTTHPGLKNEDLLAVYHFAANRIRSRDSLEDAFAAIRRNVHEELEALRLIQAP